MRSTEQSEGEIMVSFDYETSNGEVIKVYGEIVPNRPGLSEDTHLTIKFEVPIEKVGKARPQTHLAAPREKVVSLIPSLN